MSSETFLRLPEEKRNRFLESAWEEFTSVPFDKASVNQIINRAGIPRGSFYQYFTDKKDLISFLLEEVQDQVVDILRALAEERSGNLFQVILDGFDRFSTLRSGEEYPLLQRLVGLVRVNSGMNLELLFSGGPGDGRLRREYLERIDRSDFLEESEEFALQVGCLAGVSLWSALVETLRDGSRREQSRRELAAKLRIIARGALREGAAREGGIPR